MKLKDILIEINLKRDKWETIPANEIEQYEDRLFQLIQVAYKKLGGNPNFRSTYNIRDPRYTYEVMDINGDQQPEVTSVSKNTPSGIKMVATGHDDSREAKRAIIQYKIKSLHEPGHYAEVSGKLKDILISKGAPIVMDKEVVLRALPGKSIEWHGDGTYTRMIGGENFVKMMVGKPK